MDTTEIDKLLERLTESYGMGYSGGVKSVVLNELKRRKIAGEISKDGSVYGFLKGIKKTEVMLSAHLDEIGFIVSLIEENGFIRFREIGVGDCDVRILPGQEVVILGRREIRGYIAIKPPHLMPKEEREKVQSIDKLFIDTGLKPKDVKKLVCIGDTVAFKGRYLRLQGDLRSAKSLDNRASIACALAIIDELIRIGPPCHIHFVATSQEEFTGLGARIFSYRLPLDYAIVIDVTHGEHPGLREEEYFKLNGGPVIVRGPTIPQRLFQFLIETAKELEIPYQIEPAPNWTGTDADAIAFNKEGIPTCLLGIPLRYMHTPVEVVSLKDIERTARLVVNFIKRFT